MPLVNPFDVFSVTEITESINLMPNMYGRLGELNLFPVRGSPVSSVAVEERNGTLNLLSSVTPGGPATVGKENKRKVRTFNIPRIPHEEHVDPDDVRNVRAWGDQAPAMLAQLLDQRLAACKAKHDITLEWLRMGALKGTIVDGDGSTTLFNLYTEFGIVQKTVDFVLGTSTTKVSDKCREVVRHIEDNLLGDVSTGVRALVSPEFYDKLITHAKVEAAYANWAAAESRIGGDLRSGFTFGGITFEEYRGQATNAAGSTSRFIAANDGHAFPVGTLQTFATVVGPADFNETVGKLGQVYYGKVIPARADRGWDVITQSNPLPLCMRPGVLVRIYSSN